MTAMTSGLFEMTKLLKDAILFFMDLTFIRHTLRFSVNGPGLRLISPERIRTRDVQGFIFLKEAVILRQWPWYAMKAMLQLFSVGWKKASILKSVGCVVLAVEFSQARAASRVMTKHRNCKCMVNKKEKVFRNLSIKAQKDYKKA